MVRKTPPVKLPLSFGERGVSKPLEDTSKVPMKPPVIFLTPEEKVCAHKNIREIANKCKLALSKVERLCYKERANILYELPQEKTKIPKMALEAISSGLGLTFDELVFCGITADARALRSNYDRGRSWTSL